MNAVEIRPEEWLERARALKEEGWWLADLCGLDRLHLGFDDRFGIAVQMLHRERKERQTLHVAATGEPPTVPSIVGLWPGANFMEREAFDLMGIVFEGHPNLKRLLLPDEWEGHPLRKDYGVGKVPVDFFKQEFLQIHAPGQGPNSIDAGQEVDRYGQTKVDASEPEPRATDAGDRS